MFIGGSTMKANYPAAIKGGIPQQKYKVESRIQRDGVKRPDGVLE